MYYWPMLRLDANAVHLKTCWRHGLLPSDLAWMVRYDLFLDMLENGLFGEVQSMRALFERNAHQNLP